MRKQKKKLPQVYANQKTQYWNKNMFIGQWDIRARTQKHRNIQWEKSTHFDTVRGKLGTCIWEIENSYTH